MKNLTELLAEREMILKKRARDELKEIDAQIAAARAAEAEKERERKAQRRAQLETKAGELVREVDKLLRNLLTLAGRYDELANELKAAGGDADPTFAAIADFARHWHDELASHYPAALGVAVTDARTLELAEAKRQLERFQALKSQFCKAAGARTSPDDRDGIILAGYERQITGLRAQIAELEL